MNPLREAPVSRWRGHVFIYGAVIAVPAFAMLLGLAVVARKATLAEWSGLGIGVSLGAVAGVVVLYGWQLSGPVEAARATLTQRKDLYAQSQVDRAVLFAAVCGPCVLLSVVLAEPRARDVAIAMSLATALNGLSGLWYAVGVGDPWLCVRNETVPKALWTGVGAVAVSLGMPVVMFPLLVAVGALHGVFAFSGRVLAGAASQLRAALPRVGVSLRVRGRAALTETAGGAYSVASVSLVSLVAPTSVTAIFVSADRMFRAALIPVSALSSALQRGVSGADAADFRHQARRALMAHFALGLIGGAAVVFLGHDASSLLFGSQLAAPQEAINFLGLAFLAVSLNTSLGRHTLASQGRFTALLVATSSGAACGVVGILLGAEYRGVAGASAGVALGELVVLFVMVVAVVRQPAPRPTDRPRFVA